MQVHNNMHDSRKSRNVLEALPALLEGALWLSANLAVVSNLVAVTGNPVGVDIAVMAGAGIINVDMVNILVRGN